MHAASFDNSFCGQENNHTAGSSFIDTLGGIFWDRAQFITAPLTGTLPVCYSTSLLNSF